MSVDASPKDGHGSAARIAVADPAATTDEAERSAEDEAARSRFLRTAFISRIAHDIRAPTGVAAGAIHELEGALGAGAEEHKVWFTMVRRGLKRLLRLADRLSMVAELEDRPMQLTRVRMDLGTLVRNAVTGATFVQGRSAVTLEVEAPEGAFFAPVDARWLEPAISDIICNAIRFAHRRVRVAVTGHEKSTSIIVEDEGTGISPEAMASLFLRLVPRPSGSGVGISLSVAHAVVVGHAGRLRVEPSTLPPGRGEARGARMVLELDDDPAPR